MRNASNWNERFTVAAILNAMEAKNTRSTSRSQKPGGSYLTVSFASKYIVSCYVYVLQSYYINHIGILTHTFCGCWKTTWLAKPQGLGHIINQGKH